MDYEKLFKDKESGKLDKDMVLVMDNDGGYWSCENENITDEEMDKKCAEYEERYGRPDGYRDIVDVLNAAGINSEWC